MELNTNLRLRTHKNPSLIWIAVPGRSWEKKCWDRVEEVEISNWGDNDEVIHQLRAFLIRFTANPLDEYIHYPSFLHRLEYSDKEDIENVSDYGDLVHLLEDLYPEDTDFSNLPSNPPVNTKVGLERIRDFNELDKSGPLTIGRGDFSGSNGVKILDSSDLMVDSHRTIPDAEYPPYLLRKHLKKGIDESDNRYSRRGRQIKDAIGHLGHAERLKRRDIWLMPRGLRELEEPPILEFLENLF